MNSIIVLSDLLNTTVSEVEFNYLESQHGNIVNHVSRTTAEHTLRVLRDTLMDYRTKN